MDHPLTKDNSTNIHIKESEILYKTVNSITALSEWSGRIFMMDLNKPSKQGKLKV